jgi:vacuolar-type H+-ATPase subunit F/Vma7
MGPVAVIGEQAAVGGYALAGAIVVPAEDARAVREAWDSLGADVAVVVLTPRAAQALGPARTATMHPLTVVMPS